MILWKLILPWHWNLKGNLISIWTCEALVDDELGDYHFWAKRTWIENVNTTNLSY
jgi:hypothetical protein